MARVLPVSATAFYPSDVPGPRVFDTHSCFCGLRCYALAFTRPLPRGGAARARAANLRAGRTLALQLCEQLYEGAGGATGAAAAAGTGCSAEKLDKKWRHLLTTQASSPPSPLQTRKGLRQHAFGLRPTTGHSPPLLLSHPPALLSALGAVLLR